jgi:hypothetical protein
MIQLMWWMRENPRPVALALVAAILIVAAGVVAVGARRTRSVTTDAAAPVTDRAPPKVYICYRAIGESVAVGGTASPATAAAIEIDGRLDEPVWRAAPWTDDFVDIEGDLKPPPRFRTRAKMLWDDQFFYIAAELDEPHVWGTLTKRESVIFHDNDFEFFIDPDGDTHNYGEFEINALNTGWDLRLTKPYRHGGQADDGWDIAGLKTAVHVNGTLNDPRDTDVGWTIELAVPWNAIRSLDDPSAPVRRARRNGSVFESHEIIEPRGGVGEGEAAGAANPGSAGERPSVATPPRRGDRWRVNFSRVEWRHLIESGSYRKVPDSREDNWVWSPQWVIDMHRPETWGYVQFSSAPAAQR